MLSNYSKIFLIFSLCFVNCFSNELRFLDSNNDLNNKLNNTSDTKNVFNFPVKSSRDTANINFPLNMPKLPSLNNIASNLGNFDTNNNNNDFNNAFNNVLKNSFPLNQNTDNNQNNNNKSGNRNKNNDNDKVLNTKDNQNTNSKNMSEYFIPTDLSNQNLVSSLNVTLDNFSIGIEGNPTTGFCWVLANADALDSTLIKPLNLDSNYSTDNYVSIPTNGRTVGTGGNYIFQFSPLKTGKVVLRFQYKKVWENSANNYLEVKVKISK